MSAARLFIRDLTLAQFRSHALARLEPDGRPVALIGPNGAGKTNLIEAVSMLSPGRGLRRARAEDLARAPGALGWRVSAIVETPSGGREVSVQADPEGRKRVEIDAKADTQRALGAVAPMLWLTPAMDRLWIEAPEGRRRFLDRAALSFVPGHARAALDYDKAMRERTRVLRDEAPDPGWLDALEARMAVAGVALAQARVAAARRLQAAQKDARTLFPVAEISILGAMEDRIGASTRDRPMTDDQVAEIRDDFRATLARGRRDDAAAGRALAGPHRSDLGAIYVDKDMAAAQCSTGEQKALLISLVLANARALAASGGAAPVLLLDEVAAHLDASRRAALFDEICALGAQAWMTGTEAGLFEGLGARAQRFSVAEGAGGSAVRAEA